MSPLIIGLYVFTAFSVIFIIVVGPYIKKVTNNYFFWAGVGLILLIYMIVFRFNHQFSLFWRDENHSGGGLVTSQAFLLDLCPFCGFTICLSVVLDPTRKIAKIIAPFAIFGGLITLIGGLGDDYSAYGANVSPAHYIFFGDAQNPLYFLLHYINVAIGFLVLVSVPKMRVADWIYCNLFAGTYYFYVGMCMIGFHLTTNVSGLSLDDWAPGGEYYVVAQVFNSPPALAATYGFAFCYTVISLLIFGQNRLQHIKKYRWYDIRNKKTWYIGWYKLKPNLNKESESKSLLYKLCYFIQEETSPICSKIKLYFLKKSIKRLERK